MEQQLDENLDLGLDDLAEDVESALAHDELELEPGPELDLERIHREQFAFVWRTLRNLGVPTALLDDAVQDVFLVVHRRMEAFEGRSSLRTWLFGIARRVAYRYRRSAARQQRKLDALADDVEPRQPSPYAVVAQGEAFDILTGFLDTLDDAKREVFVLHTLEGVTGGEIASTLGISVNTVHSRLRLARRSFERMCERLQVREERALANARRDADPPEQARGRAWALLLPVLELPRETLAASSAWTLASQVKLFAVTVALGTVGLGAVKVSTTHPDTTPNVLVASASAAGPVRAARPAPEPAPVDVLETPAPDEPDAVPRQRPRAKPSAPEPTASTLAAETKAMLQLRALVQGGDPAAALARIDELDRRYPDGEFALEREGYRIVARCRASHSVDAQARSFVAAHPGSPVAAQVRAGCLE